VADYEWPAVAEHDRSHDEEREFIGTDESDLDAVVAALTRLEEAGR
jgi:hypothetical protein